MSFRAKRKRQTSEDLPSKDSNSQTKNIIDVEKVEGTPTKRSKMHISRVRTLNEISNNDNSDSGWRKWISATATKNYLLRDPLLDWLKCNSESKLTPSSEIDNTLPPENLCDSTDITIGDSSTPNTHTNNFTNYIMEQGNIFESGILRLLRNKFGNGNVITLATNLHSSRSIEYVQRTFDAMNRGVYIIHSGVLHNPKNKTYGIPDLLVRSDIIHRIVNKAPISKEESLKSASRLRDPNNPSKPPKYHYIVVDIKFTTLRLRADGIHLCNGGMFAAYKSQLYVYLKALSRIQGYNPNYAFLLGRRWSRITKSERISNENCFDALGRIDYSKIDSSYISKTKKAVGWVRLCRDDSARSWDISTAPLPRPELYPNMCNNYDGEWREMKKKIAEQIREITLLWRVGTKHRERAHSLGIYQWDDERCDITSLGIREDTETGRVLTHILDINRNDDELILPDKITNNIGGWKDDVKIRLFIDFETINDAVMDMTKLPYTEHAPIIFMIGVGYVVYPNSDDDESKLVYNYKNFTIDKISHLNEKKMVYEFYNYVRSIIASCGCSRRDVIQAYHWGSVEKVLWEGLTEKYRGLKELWEWVDMRDIFVKEPIVIKGCFGYGLKEIATKMKEHNFITSGWDKYDNVSPIADGRGAMVGAWQCHKQSVEMQMSMKDIPLMHEIIKYNEVDTRVLFEMLSYLRYNHTA